MQHHMQQPCTTTHCDKHMWCGNLIDSGNWILALPCSGASKCCVAFKIAHIASSDSSPLSPTVPSSTMSLLALLGDRSTVCSAFQAMSLTYNLAKNKKNKLKEPRCLSQRFAILGVATGSCYGCTSSEFSDLQPCSR